MSFEAEELEYKRWLLEVKEAKLLCLPLPRRWICSKYLGKPQEFSNYCLKGFCSNLEIFVIPTSIIPISLHDELQRTGKYLLVRVPNGLFACPRMECLHCPQFHADRIAHGILSSTVVAPHLQRPAFCTEE
jgi:hypothetical protein